MKDGRVEGRIRAENVPWNPGQISPVCTTCVYITLGIGVCVHVLCVDFNCINFCFQGDDLELGPRSRVSLLDQHTELKKKAEGKLLVMLYRVHGWSGKGDTIIVMKNESAKVSKRSE